MTPEEITRLTRVVWWNWPRKVRVRSTGKTGLLVAPSQSFGSNYGVVTDGGGCILVAAEDIERKRWWRRNR